MELILGGAFQGKLNYLLAQKKEQGIFYDVEKDIAYGGKCTYEELLIKPICKDLHLFIKRILEKEFPELSLSSVEDCICLSDCLIIGMPDRIIISDDIGGGIVPMASIEREYREKTGQVYCILAQRAEHVTRVICGIGKLLK